MLDATHPDAGIGFPAGYPDSVWTVPVDAVTDRDRALLRLAWDAAAAGQQEITLTDAITAEAPVDTRWAPPHVELGGQVNVWH